jgi:hypothetical protein
MLSLQVLLWIMNKYPTSVASLIPCACPVAQAVLDLLPVLLSMPDMLVLAVLPVLPVLPAGSSGGLSVTLTASTAASHVLLTSQTPGYFTDNALMALHPCLSQTLTFIPASSLQQQPTPAAFLSGLRVESLYNHQFGSAAREVEAVQPGDQGPTGQQLPVRGSSRVFHGTPLAPINANNSVADTAAAGAPSAAL